MQPGGNVTSMGAMQDQALLINGGFFVLRREIFAHIEEGEELVEKPFSRLIAQQRLNAFRWDGFWQCMDTFKDKISFDRMEARGECPWMVWKPASGRAKGKD
jgi:glucose-1-phosphate cytidylyltransferase